MATALTRCQGCKKIHAPHCDGALTPALTPAVSVNTRRGDRHSPGYMAKYMRGHRSKKGARA